MWVVFTILIREVFFSCLERREETFKTHNKCSRLLRIIRVKRVCGKNSILWSRSIKVLKLATINISRYHCFHSDRSQYTNMFIPKRRKFDEDFEITQTTSLVTSTTNINNDSTILAAGTTNLTTSDINNTSNMLNNHHNSSMNNDSSSSFSLSLPLGNNSSSTTDTSNNNNSINHTIGNEHQDRHQTFNNSLDSSSNNDNITHHNNSNPTTSYSSALTSFSSFTCDTPPPPPSEYTTPLNWFQPINPELFVDNNQQQQNFSSGTGTTVPGGDRHHTQHHEALVTTTDKSGTTRCQHNDNVDHRSSQFLSHTTNFSIPTTTTTTTSFVGGSGDREDLPSPYYSKDTDDVDGEQKLSNALNNSGPNQIPDNSVILASRIWFEKRCASLKKRQKFNGKVKKQ